MTTKLDDYALKTEIRTGFYTRDQSDLRYQRKGDYVTTAGLTTTLNDYALKTEIPTDFYTKSQSDEKYQVKGNYVTDISLSIELSNYSTTGEMNRAINTAITGAIEGAY